MIASPAYGLSLPRVSTKKEFLALPENKTLRRELAAAGIICYVCAAITAILGVAVIQNPYVLLDAAIVAGLGLGIHLSQSRACAVILCVYALINVIISVVTTGVPGGEALAAVSAGALSLQINKSGRRRNVSAFRERKPA